MNQESRIDMSIEITFTDKNEDRLEIKHANVTQVPQSQSLQFLHS